MLHDSAGGSEAGSYLGPKDFVYHSTLGLRVIRKKKLPGGGVRVGGRGGVLAQPHHHVDPLDLHHHWLAPAPPR